MTDKAIEVVGIIACPFAHSVISGVALQLWEESAETCETIGGAWSSHVECYDCHAEGPGFLIANRKHGDAKAVARDRAVAAWNTRADTATTRTGEREAKKIR